jgi:hypothetical protein
MRILRAPQGRNRKEENQMPEESEKDILKRMDRTLGEIRSILAITNQDKVAQAKKGLLKEGSMKLQVYDLCDGTKTTKDIADALQKSTDYVFSYLSILRREGLIRTFEKDGNQVHEQIF